MSPEEAKVVSASDLEAAYADQVVWSGATFDIAPGEFVAVLGPNGAGKSTLIRMLLGLLPPRSGSLQVFGAAALKGNPRIGYVPQRRPIDPDLRLAGIEFVRLGLNGHRWGTGWRRPGEMATVSEAVSAVGATGYAHSPIGTLSGGELQRLMLAQAIVSSPELLLLDEPLASLDVRNQLSVAALVGDLARQRGITVMLIAHDANPLLPVIDRVLYVARGRVAIGTPAEVITSARLSRLYQANVEVLRDSRGRLFVVGLDGDESHALDGGSSHDH